MKKKKDFTQITESQCSSFDVKRSPCKFYLIIIRFPFHSLERKHGLEQNKKKKILLLTSGGLHSVFFLAMSSQLVLNTVPPDSD